MAIPEILGWDLDEFDRSRSMQAFGVGALVAVDYLQLITHFGDHASAVATLSERARGRRWRLILGVMAPRRLLAVEGDIAAVHAARITSTILGSELETVNRTVVLTGAGVGRRRVTMTSGSRVRWSQTVSGP